MTEFLLPFDYFIYVFALSFGFNFGLYVFVKCSTCYKQFEFWRK